MSVSSTEKKTENVSKKQKSNELMRIYYSKNRETINNRRRELYRAKNPKKTKEQKAKEKLEKLKKYLQELQDLTNIEEIRNNLKKLL